MEKTITWTKGTFDSNYQLFENGIAAGSLNADIWKNQALAFKGNKQFRITSDGIFSNTFKIFEGNNQIGFFENNTWKSRSDIMLNNGERFQCNFDTWRSKWNITNFKDKNISYTSSSNSGIIVSNFDDDAVLFAGLYIKQQHNNLFLFVIFVVLFVTIIL